MFGIKRHWKCLCRGCQRPWQGLWNGIPCNVSLRLHLAVAGGLSIASGHAGGDLGGTADGLLPALNRPVRLLRRQASVIRVRGHSLAYFLLPERCGV